MNVWMDECHLFIPLGNLKERCSLVECVEGWAPWHGAEVSSALKSALLCHCLQGQGGSAAPVRTFTARQQWLRQGVFDVTWCPTCL
jgi:hypothetical protein